MYLQACVVRHCNLCTPNQDVLLLTNVGFQIRFRAHIQLIAQNTDPYKLMVCSAIAFDRATAGAPHYWYVLDYVSGCR
jgi:hypothetical protein